MPAPIAKIDRNITPPLLLRVFYREGTYPPVSDLSQNPAISAPSTETYVWQNTTLLELSYNLILQLKALLPDPYIGTRLSYRLVYADTRKSIPDGRAIGSNGYDALPKYLTKDLGSVVLGGELALDEEEDEQSNGRTSIANNYTKDDDVTVADGRFITGDFITLAILPPLQDGSIAPPLKETPPIRLNDPSFNGHRGEGGIPGMSQRSRAFGMSQEYGNRGRGVGYGFGRGRGGGGDASFPSGEWRRGEQLPPNTGRGVRGRFRGREDW